jgi:predicted XRE-type DNA-binding protein
MAERRKTARRSNKPAGKRLNKHRGSSIDDFLKIEEGVFEEFQARAVKEVIAWQLAEAMKKRKLSKRRLAQMMHTSRTQIDRVLDPKDGNVTIETLQRAAALVGRKVQVEIL